MPLKTTLRPDAAHGLTTQQLAFALSLHPQTLRKRLSQTGAYFGLRPTKLPNGRLLWPADSLERLTKGGR